MKAQTTCGLGLFTGMINVSLYVGIKADLKFDHFKINLIIIKKMIKLMWTMIKLKDIV